MKRRQRWAAAFCAGLTGLLALIASSDAGEQPPPAAASPEVPLDVDALFRTLRDEALDDAQREQAADALIETGRLPERDRPEIAEFYTHRLEALLAKVPWRQLEIPGLEEGHWDSVFFPIRECRRKLAGLGPAAVAPLCRLLRSTGPDARREIVETLATVGPAAVPAMAEMLRGPSPDLREAAAKVLEGIGPGAAPAVPGLIEALRAKSLRVRHALAQDNAANALARIGPGARAAVPALAEALRDPTACQSAANALAAIGPDAAAAIPNLIEFIEGRKDFHGRFAAVRALGRIGRADEKVIATLSRAVREEFPGPGAEALARFGPAAAKAAPALIEAIQKKETHKFDREQVIRALGNIGPEAKAAIPALIEIAAKAPGKSPAATFHDETLELRERAVEALGKMGPLAASARPTLVALLKHDNPRLRAAAVGAIVSVEPAEALSTLIAALQDPEASVARVEIAEALTRLGERARPAIPVLGAILANETDRAWQRPELLKAILAIDQTAAIRQLGANLASRNNDGRLLAIDALLRLGAASAPVVPDLIRRLEDPLGYVRRAAAETLGLVGPPAAEAAVPALIRRLKDPYHAAREAAATALGRLGRAAGPALPALEESGRDDDPVVQKSARAAAESIRRSLAEGSTKAKG